ncbi:MAG: HAMP domain-containing histidine kinase [Ignavibacteria bacterium]|nr:HAMP domain-containing histidine kinase [Ignavibacteria bacterium]
MKRSTEGTTMQQARVLHTEVLEQDRDHLLSTLERLKIEFLNRVSHEFRTPLTSIIGYSDLLRDERSLDPEQQAEIVQIIGDESRRLSRLLNDYLDLARLESGRTALLKQNTDLVGLVNQAINVLQPIARRRSITIEFEIPAEQMMVKIDPARILRALLNILSSSLKFTPERGKIKINLHASASYMEIHVSDNGPGVCDDGLPFLFNIFGNGKDPVREAQGAELGLAIARYLVELHGGSLGVNGTKGSGSVFTIQVPQN